jgi:hypothetical protein
MQQLPNRQFIFHNAGQGLFYSGKINGFEFVYDCGSIRKQHLTDLVLDYKHTLLNGKLNLLILSHLHEDHVAGLFTLFHRNPKTAVERVILPYLSPIERLVLAIGAPAPDTGDWYYNFLSDPVQFFVERGVQRITYLGGSERDQQTENPDKRDNEQSDRFTDKLKDSIALRKVILDNEPHLSQFLTGKLQIKSHYGAIIISANSIYWQFRFFNYSVKPETLQPFSDCIRSIINGESLSEIITNQQKREQLRDCYKSLHKTDFNNTSLLVLHGPLYNHGSVIPNNYSQLLTGDINLKQHVSEITGHFGSSLSDVTLCLIPHHGSKRNWDKAILPFLSRRCRWVVSTGRGNKSQPCSDILKDIKKTRSRLFYLRR